jgi:hypothetical protein
MGRMEEGGEGLAHENWIRHGLQMLVAMIAVGAVASIRRRRATP